MYVNPEGAKGGDDLRCEFRFQREEGDPLGAQVNHCEHILATVNGDRPRFVQIDRDGAEWGG